MLVQSLISNLWFIRFGIVAAIVIVFSINLHAEDAVELVTGVTVRGKVKEQTEKEVSLEVTVGAKTFNRKFPLNRVKSITIDGERKEFNPSTTAAGSKTRPGATGTSKASTVSAGPTKSRAEIESLIETLGKTPPDWYESTPLVYPQSLDLTFPQKPEGNWNNQKNVGQYIWDVINPNENKWREGVRLMHHLLVLNKDNLETQRRIMATLGTMYHNLHQDYARAAFWWRKAGVEKAATANAVHLAECYFRLGNKQMAVQLLTKVRPQLSSIKLWGDLGNLKNALQLAEAAARSAPDAAYVAAGDACRTASQFQQALRYYQKVLDVPARDPGKARIERNQQRAQASIEAIKLFELSDVNRVADGTYEGNSLGYEGQIHVEVAVQNHRIESVKITQHKEKQFYSALSDTPRKIIEKQGVKGVDATSSATITSEAIINATAKALASGAK